MRRKSSHCKSRAFLFHKRHQLQQVERFMLKGLTREAWCNGKCIRLALGWYQVRISRHNETFFSLSISET